MDQKFLHLIARISAIELLLPSLFSDVYKLRGMTRDDVVAKHNKFQELLRLEGAPGADPAMSDLICGELEDAVASLLAKIEARFP